MEKRVVVSCGEISAIRGLLARIAEQHDGVEDPAFLKNAPLLAHELPARLRAELLEFLLVENESVLILSGFPIDQEKIGPTPKHWSHQNGRSPAFEEEALLVLFGSLLGRTIGWATQQDGRVVHDILPIKEHENEQLGSGSKQPLWWHTEDAFHPYRGDYICLMCLRNPDDVPTTICSVDEILIEESHRNILFEPRFTIRPDESHLPKNRGRDLDGVAEESYGRIEDMNTAPEKIAVFSGHMSSPYWRIDPYFMDRLEEDREAQEALDSLISEVDERIREVPLEAGDFCFIDNFRAVHGRRPFEARFDGTDRWLKRINVARDLRKSRSARLSSDSLIIS